MTPRHAIRRILAAVDASPLSLAALDLAAVLAGRLGAELEVLTVEDLNLVRLAAHPMVRATSVVSCRPSTLDESTIRRALTLQVAEARRALERALTRHKVRGSLTVRRGLVPAELLAASDRADLVMLGWTGRAAGGRPRLGSNARLLAQRARAPVFLLRQVLGPDHPVVAAYDGTPASDRALAVAAALAERDGGAVLVLVLARPAAAADLERHVRAALGGLTVTVKVVAPDDPELLLRTVRAAGDPVLVAGADATVPIDSLPCSVVVVR